MTNKKLSVFYRSFIISTKNITCFSKVNVFLGNKEFSVGSVFEWLEYDGFINK